MTKANTRAAASLANAKGHHSCDPNSMGFRTARIGEGLFIPSPCPGLRYQSVPTIRLPVETENRNDETARCSDSFVDSFVCNGALALTTRIYSMFSSLDAMRRVLDWWPRPCSRCDAGTLASTTEAPARSRQSECRSTDMAAFAPASSRAAKRNCKPLRRTR